ncbi:hypothetical protein F5I97DRAFT_1931483 [Phlebopus sp. FC_14]|nr:hypothetical protein F5I97DRAFT_1931483 [Phlebopus sp. FC_14]
MTDERDSGAGSRTSQFSLPGYTLKRFDLGTILESSSGPAVKGLGHAEKLCETRQGAYCRLGRTGHLHSQTKVSKFTQAWPFATFSCIQTHRLRRRAIRFIALSIRQLPRAFYLPLFTRKFKKLYLRDLREAHACQTWLSTIAPLCPSLQDLTVRGARQADLSFIGDWVQLKSFQYDSVTAKAFESAASSHPHGFFRIPKDFDSWTSLQLNPSSFPELKMFGVFATRDVEPITYLRR